MRTILVIMFFFSLQFHNAQTLKIEKLNVSNSKNNDDLSFLKEEIKDRKMVMLGELTHQYGTIFEMKTRVVEYLHKELGFTTFAMESSMYDLWKKNLHQNFNPVDFNNAVYGVWSKTKEFQRLVNYIDKHQLKVIGFDSQISYTNEFIDDFFDFCESNNIKIKLDEEDMAIVLEGVLNDNSFEEYDMKFSAYEKELKRIIKKIKSFKNTELNYYWLQFFKGVLAASRDAYVNTKEAPSYDFLSPEHNIRDAQMSDNILSYIERHPSEKIILWADNIHIINSTASIKDSKSQKFVSMGNHIKNRLGNDVYSLATLHANDSISYRKKWSKTPILMKSFENELVDLGIPNLFVSSNQESMKIQRKNRLVSYLNYYESRLDQLHDGYIFMKHAKDSEPYIAKSTINNQYEAVVLDSLQKENKIIRKKTENTIFKGKVIDLETKAAIPYATVILKKQEIYRVCDINGNFAIPISKQMKKDAIVDISSMGFTPKTIPLNMLSDIIYLNPSVESLEEVVIKAYKTPLSVMKIAVRNIKNNNPTTPFNYQKYTKVKININDKDILDIDLLRKEYDQGYRQLNRSTGRVDQIKWNKNDFGNKIKNTHQLLGRYRQNALRYSNIVHRRKYKKFDLEFIKSKNPDYEGLYIIQFKTNRNKWNYTNRGYPTNYSGKIYINKEDFSIVKIIENWETTLTKTDIEKYGFYDTRMQYSGKLEEVKIKEENTCVYNKHNDGKYYGHEFFNKSYLEYKNNKGKLYYYMFSEDSSLFDVKSQDVEVIDYDHHHQNETILRRVKFNKDFWDSFSNTLYKKINGKN